MQEAETSVPSFNSGLESLMAEHAEKLIFVHPVWLQTWLSEFGDHCEPLLLHSGSDGYRGFAPLMRIEERLTFVGDSSICDFMDFLVAPETESAAYADLWQQIRDEDWSLLDLWGLRASSATRDAITTLAREAGYAVHEELEAVSPRVDLPGSWDEYLATLNKKDRHELRRKIRRLFESGAEVTFDVLREQQAVSDGIETFFDLHTRSRMDKTEFMTPEMATFFRRMASALAAADLIRLFMLYVNKRPAACVLGFDAGSHIYLYNSGYDPEFSSLAVGLVSKALVLQWAIENGKTGVDFLRGDESYKYDLGAVNQEIYQLTVRR